MNWFISAIFFQIFLSLVTIITFKIKYKFLLEINSGSTTGMEITSSIGLEWDNKKIQFFRSVYFFLLLEMPVIVMVEIVFFGAASVISDMLNL